MSRFEGLILATMRIVFSLNNERDYNDADLMNATHFFVGVESNSLH
jgi:hypothetical protein